MCSSKAAVQKLEIWLASYSANYLPAAARVVIAKGAKGAVREAAALPAQTVAAAEAAEVVQQVREANASDFHGPFLNTTPRQTQAQGFDGHLILDHTMFHSAQPTENRSPLMCHRYIL